MGRTAVGHQLPVLLLALPAGAIADLMDRKRLLIITNILMLAASAVLAIVTAMGRVDPAMLLGQTVLLAIGAALNSPAWAASVPLTVPRRSLSQALALNSVGFNIARAIGPEEAVDGAARHLDVEVVDHPALAEGLGETGDVDHQRGGGHGRCTSVTGWPGCSTPPLSVASVRKLSRERSSRE